MSYHPRYYPLGTTVFPWIAEEQLAPSLSDLVNWIHWKEEPNHLGGIDRGFAQVKNCRSETQTPAL